MTTKGGRIVPGTTTQRRWQGGIRLTVIAVLACVTATKAPRAQETAQEPTPTFRAAIEAVAIDVYVTDEDGKSVPGLKIDDFELFESGVAQPITTFTPVDIPIPRMSTGEREIAEPDVQANNGPLGRLYVFAYDSGSVLRTRRLARDFIENHFRPHDVAAFVLLGRALATNGQDFTSNRRLLLEAIDKFNGGGGGGQCNEPEQAGQGDSIPLPSRYQGRSIQFDSLRKITELLARMPARHKSLLLFTKCLGLDMLDIQDYGDRVMGLAFEDAHAMMTAATRSNVAIYPIDPDGLGGDVPLVQIGRFRDMADMTGGTPLINSNNFSQLFDRIVQDNSTYYMLGFNSAHAKDDGRYVPIEVRVKRPSLVVRTRGGFLVPTPWHARELERERARETPPASEASAAIASPITTDGLPMRVFATPLRRGKDKGLVALALELDASRLDLTREDGAYVGEVDVSYVATDERRKIYPERRHTASIRIEPEAGEPEPLENVRVRIMTELELDKGRYQLRVGSSTARQSGSVVYDLVVPDFSDGGLTMSGLALVSLAEPNVLTLQADRRQRTIGVAVKCYSDRCAAPVAPASEVTRVERGDGRYMDGRLPGSTTTVREFAAGDRPTLAVEVYDNRRLRRNAPHTIALAASLRAPGGTTIPLAEETRPADAPRNEAGAHPFALPLMLAGVPAGTYALRVEATSTAGEGFSAFREIPIRIR